MTGTSSSSQFHKRKCTTCCFLTWVFGEIIKTLTKRKKSIYFFKTDFIYKRQFSTLPAFAAFGITSFLNECLQAYLTHFAR